MTRLFIENYELDLLQDFSNLITYAVDDLNNFDSKSTSFTKTIVLPATANNNRLLGNIFEFSNSNFTSDSQPNVLYNFNASKSAKARIEINGLQVMKGTIRLLEIFIDGKNTEYEVALFGELGSFISKVGAKKITDNDNGIDNLDFSEYNHVYSVANILGSWNPNYEINTSAQFYAPNYCTLFGRKAYLFEVGKQYTISNTASNNVVVVITDILEFGTFPTIVTKLTFNITIVNEAYGSVTFSYPKAGSSFIYPLIDYGTVSYNIPSTNPVYFAKKDYQLRAFRPAFFIKEIIDKIIAAAGYTWKSNFFNTDFFQRLILPNNYKGLLRKNTFNYVDSTTNIAQTCNSLNSFPTCINSKILLFNSPTLATNFNYNSTTGFFQFTGANAIQIKLSLNLNYTFTQKNGNGIIDIISGGQSISTITTEVGTRNVNTNTIFTLNPNDSFAIRMYTTNAQAIGNYANLSVDSGATISVISEPADFIPYQLGETILMNDLLPKNILQKDFFISILKMFNLMVTEDKFTEKKLIIEPWIDFYKVDESYLDWSDKVARNEIIKIKPMSEVSARYYTLKYKDDSDYYNERYKKQYNQTYGTRTYDNGLEFAKDTATTEVIFAPTPLVGYPNCDKIVSTIFKLNNNNEETVESVIRIMQFKIIEGVSSWKIINTNAGTTSVLATLTNYCYAGHLDDPDIPNADINFGATKELYFTLLSGALSNNIFNAFYSSYLAEITDKDSRLVTCKMKFEEKDIFNLDFGRFVWVDGVLYRLIKIVDYCDNNVCEAQLLRVIYTTYDLPQIETQRMSFEIEGFEIGISEYFNVNNSGSNLDFRVYWGDGTSDDYTGLDSYLISHTYFSNSTWKIEFEYINNPVYYNLTLDIQSSYLPTFKNFKNIKSFFNHSLASGGFVFGFTNSNISVNEVNNILHECISCFESGDFILIYNNSPLSIPTGQGITDKALLQSIGVTVQTD